ncbi:MAG TPA: STAS domain-containing protein [Mycobacteriales bacterium]|jgi:anti-anti-sigma factor|nr:STAS domain-containing protein [Mycobacteriales bacterium]
MGQLVTVVVEDSRPVAALIGELDAAGVDAASAALVPALHRHGGLVVDLAHLRFLDCAGLGALVGLRLEAERAGLPFSVARPSLPVARLIRLAGGPDLLVVHRRLDRALQAMVRVREIV